MPNAKANLNVRVLARPKPAAGFCGPSCERLTMPLPFSCLSLGAEVRARDMLTVGLGAEVRLNMNAREDTAIAERSTVTAMCNFQEVQYLKSE